MESYSLHQSSHSEHCMWETRPSCCRKQWFIHLYHCIVVPGTAVDGDLVCPDLFSSWWRFGLFQAWAIQNGPAVKSLWIHVCWCTCVPIPPQRVGFLGHRGWWPLEDAENFQSGWTNAHSHQEGKMVPTAPHAFPHEACSVFLSWAFPVRVTWWLSAVWMCILLVIQALNTFS